jgi:hypothetical protein
MEIRSVGIDLGKTTFHLVALGDNCKVLLKKKTSGGDEVSISAVDYCDRVRARGKARRGQHGSSIS